MILVLHTHCLCVQGRPRCLPECHAVVVSSPLCSITPPSISRPVLVAFKLWPQTLEIPVFNIQKTDPVFKIQNN
jgi:hypothetical protein